MKTKLKIKSIKRIGKRKTIDIQVSKNNLFFAHGVLTHNCGFNTVSPGMENVSESIGLAATADIMCSIWQDDEDKALSRLNIGFIKNRFGPNYGHGVMKCNYDTLSLSETSPDYFDPPVESDDPVANVESAIEKLKKLQEDE